MILERIIDPKYVNYDNEYLSPDVPTSKYVEHDLEAFHNYPKLNYKFNDRGFRDEEWPQDLQNKIWLVGDSGSMGVGVPYDCIYPVIAEKELGIRIIKACKLNGNNYHDIYKYTEQLLNELKPKVIFVQWSFLWRNHITKSDLIKTSNKMDIDVTIGYIKSLEKIKGNTRLIHIFTPMIHSYGDFLKTIETMQLEKIYAEDIDLARDMLHLGIESNKVIAQTFIDYIRNNNVPLK